MQLAGELAKISVPSVIQLLHNGQMTGKVCFMQGANSAFLYVKDGRLIHAETDAEQGRDAVVELCLWEGGTFSFVEGGIDGVPLTLVDEHAERMVHEGLSCLERKRQLDQLRINLRTVLRPVEGASSEHPLFKLLDGRTALGAIRASLKLHRYDYITCVHDLLTRGLAVVVQQPVADEGIKLPDWVVSRLKQDNADISQAIVEMVIWVDRVKCWMYQADADLDRVIDQMGQNGPQAAWEFASE